jgi:DNA-binding response OmpR family regulator
MLPNTELTILLIEDEPDAAALVQHVLGRGNAGGIAVEPARDLKSGLSLLARRRFDAILLDLNLPDSSGFDTFAAVRQNAADAAVIVLTGHEDEALALQAVRSGADEYLIKNDIRDRFLAQRVRYAVERRRSQAMGREQSPKNGRIFTFLGAKGGSGSSTLVVNLAAVLAQSGKSVLAIEMMPEYGSFAALLNHAPAWNLSTLLHRAPEAIYIETLASCLESCNAGFQVLFGPQHPDEYGHIPPGHARALIAAARRLADYVLIDASSTLSPAVREVIPHSALTALVVERNRLGLHAALARAPVMEAIAGSSDTVGVMLVDKAPYSEFLGSGEFGRQLGARIVGILPPGPELQSGGEVLPVAQWPEGPYSQCLQEMALRLASAPVRFRAA